MRRPNKPSKTFTVKTATTLLPFLLEALGGTSRNRIKAILGGGGIKVDRAIVKQFDHPLRPGMQVEISQSKLKSELKSSHLRLVYEDEFIVVIDKSAGILSMAGSPHIFSVKTILDDYFAKTHKRCRAHVVHRLDRETSGLLVYAKTIEAEQILEHNWQRIVRDRRYVAVLSGVLETPSGTVRNWLKDNKAYVTYSSPTDNGGKFAVTHFRRLKHSETHTLAEFKLETGRKNQIRVHAQDLGHPVCGDTKYGNGDNPIGRLCLHAYRLDFYHPITGELLHFETPYPKPFLSVLQK